MSPVGTSVKVARARRELKNADWLSVLTSDSTYDLSYTSNDLNRIRSFFCIYILVCP